MSFLDEDLPFWYILFNANTIHYLQRNVTVEEKKNIISFYLVMYRKHHPQKMAPWHTEYFKMKDIEKSSEQFLWLSYHPSFEDPQVTSS